MSEWELLIRVDGSNCYVVEAKPAGFPWTHLERTKMFWRLVSVPLLPVEIDWLLNPKPRTSYLDSARVVTLGLWNMPAMPREGITPISRERFFEAVQ